MGICERWKSFVALDRLTLGTLIYDLLDHFVSWNAGSQSKDLSVYDASGTRVLRRTTTSSGTTMTVYAFGQEEHTYFNASGHKGDLYYYTLGGRLLGALDNSGKTTFYLSDALGSVLASFSNVATSAAIKGNQVFGPYGNARDYQGTINTAKGYTGQYTDSLTGLDYYNSRYYDQVAGVFLSADVKQGNMQGMNPYGYVGGNPETKNDPSGQMACAGPGGPCGWPTKPLGGVTGGGGSSNSNSLVPYTPPSLVIPFGGVTPSSSGIVPPSNSVSSCGTPGPSQPLCGNYGVNFALYLSTGGEVGVPGGWCLECGFGGGSNGGAVI